MSAALFLDPAVRAGAAAQATAVSPSRSASPAEPVAASSSVSPLLPNPRLTVDAGLNRVVLEFFNSTGVLTNSSPSQKQLEAYRLAAASGQPAAGAGG